MAVSCYGSLLEQLRDWSYEPCAAVYYIDIRHLRSINRIASASEGDEVISRVSELLRAWTGRYGISGRLWSNEFVAVKMIDHTQVAVEDATELRDRLAELRYHSPIGENALSVSIGVTVVRPDTDWVQAIADAGEACELSKSRGLNQIYCHTAGNSKPGTPLVNAGYVENFRHLLASGQLALHPQPIMDIRPEQPLLRKAEFLLRMEKNGVFMPIPAGTIETLEYFGLVNELDRFSSTFMLDWLADNPAALDRLHSVSINLSARSIVDGNFMDALLRDVRSAHLPHGKLCFEITETAAIEHLDIAAEVIGAFRSFGCGFSLDDFGSGLCSFGYLQSLPVDEVKIDGRFIRDVAQSGVSQEIVRAIHQVAHATGKRTVAEFVDDPRKLRALRNIGVDYAQGWLFYPTVTPEKFVELLST
ncbi:MAG: GGDEF domain-containing phosphodiesterase [Nevskia sp.]|jgi:diguanylate cyclase (GGDEF)-like protein|nr:GGDEF domain-containing phosphodiesterase [Nevskia sp.]